MGGLDELQRGDSYQWSVMDVFMVYPPWIPAVAASGYAAAGVAGLALLSGAREGPSGTRLFVFGSGALRAVRAGRRGGTGRW